MLRLVRQGCDFHFVALEYFGGKVEVVDSTGAGSVVHDDRLTVAWGFGEFGVTIDEGIENETLEMGAHILDHLPCKAQP